MYKYIYHFEPNSKPMYSCYYKSQKIGSIIVENNNKYIVNKIEFDTLNAAKNFLENTISYRSIKL